MADQDLTLLVGPDVRVLTFAAIVSIASAFVFGLMPALTATRVNVTPVLNERARGAGAGGRFALHNTIVVTQVALSVIVLVGAGLFVRTLTNLLRLDTGFDRQNLTVFELQPPNRYDAARRTAVYQAVMDGCRDLQRRRRRIRSSVSSAATDGATASTFRATCPSRMSRWRRKA